MNNQTKKFSEVIDEAQFLSRHFSKLDPKLWTPEIKTLDLLTKLGNLSQLILYHQSFKKSRPKNLNLSTELALIFFIVLDLADTYNIDFPKAFAKLISDTQSDISAH